jgi:hypothetical protein
MNIKNKLEKLFSSNKKKLESIIINCEDIIMGKHKINYEKYIFFYKKKTYALIFLG